WRPFCAGWLGRDGGRSRTSTDLVPLATLHLASELSDLRNHFESLPPNAKTHRLSRALRKLLGRPIGDADDARRLRQVAGRVHGLVRWELEPVRSRKTE